MTRRDRFTRALVPTLRRPPRLGLLAALLVAAAASSSAAFLELQVRTLAERAPFILFFLAVFLASWLGGLAAGFLAIAESAVLANVLVVAPAGGRPFSPESLELTALFLVVATAIHLALVTLREAWQAQDALLAEARRRRDELAAALRARDEFLVVAGHELRTPLTALQLQLEALVRAARRGAPRFEELVEERLGRTIGHVRRLDALVGQLLDVSRLTAAGLELTLEPLDFADVVESAAGRLAAAAERVGSPIRLDLGGPLTGRFDRVRLEQVTTHLLTNAVKYGMGQPVDVELRREGDAARLRVRDRGIGITAGAEARIFGRFERAVSERHYGGLGLGLWVVRRIVEAGGGSIEVESSAGAGSIFTVRLPLAPQPGAARAG